MNLAAASLCDGRVSAVGEQKPSARALKTNTSTSSVAASAGDTGVAVSSMQTVEMVNVTAGNVSSSLNVSQLDDREGSCETLAEANKVGVQWYARMPVERSAFHKNQTSPQSCLSPVITSLERNNNHLNGTGLTERNCGWRKTNRCMFHTHVHFRA